jgi:glucokinase
MSEKLRMIVDTTGVKKKDYEELVKVVNEIFSKITSEAPNSATFSMAMDILEKQGKLFKVVNKKISYEEIPETVEIK